MQAVRNEYWDVWVTRPGRQHNARQPGYGFNFVSGTMGANFGRDGHTLLMNYYSNHYHRQQG
jgi:hypothetical protein